MKLYPNQLSSHLQQQLAPCYLISGDEPLLIDEAVNAVIAAAKSRQFDNRERHTLDAQFNWGLLAGEATRSMFGDKKVVELRVPNGKLGQAHSKALQQYLAQTNPDILLILLFPKIDKAGQRAKWFQAIDAAGATIAVWPIDAQKLPQWLIQRGRSLGLQLLPDAAQALAERVTGNLLAAQQSLEKLALLHCSAGNVAKIDAAMIKAACVNDSRYQVFALNDAVLLGNITAALKILQQLRVAHTEAALVLWTLNKELQTIMQICQQLQAGIAIAQAFKNFGVWQQKQAAMQRAVHRFGSDTNLAELVVAQLNHCDRILKGQRRGNLWDELTNLVLAACGDTQLSQHNQHVYSEI